MICVNLIYVEVNTNCLNLTLVNAEARHIRLINLYEGNNAPPTPHKVYSTQGLTINCSPNKYLPFHLLACKLFKIMIILIFKTLLIVNRQLLNVNKIKYLNSFWYTKSNYLVHIINRVPALWFVDLKGP